jgi:hypothetical protein
MVKTTKEQISEQIKFFFGKIMHILFLYISIFYGRDFKKINFVYHLVVLS